MINYYSFENARFSALQVFFVKCLFISVSSWGEWGLSLSPLHWCLSLAALVASVHDWNPRSCFLSMVLIQVSYGVHQMVTFAYLVFFHLRRLMTMLFFHFGPSAYLLICYPLWQYIFNILRLLCMNVSTMFSSFFFSFSKFLLRREGRIECWN